MSKSYGQVVASVVAEKKMHPERFCESPRCLWRIRNAEGKTISVCPRQHTPVTPPSIPVGGTNG